MNYTSDPIGVAILVCTIPPLCVVVLCRAIVLLFKIRAYIYPLPGQ